MKQNDSINRPVAEVENFETRKRRVYKVALVCGALIFMLSWLVHTPQDIFVKYLYPIFALMLALILTLIWFTSLPTRKLELPIVGIITVMIMARLAWHYHMAGPIDEHLLALTGGHYWAVGALIVGVFVMLDRKWGTITSIGLVALATLIAATSAAGEIARGELSTEAIVYLVRIHLFLILMLGLTSAATSMRDKLMTALSRAEILGEWATTDMLTGLANRRAAEEFLNNQIAARMRYGSPLSVILADLDHFKRINDTRGHAVGDKALENISHIIVSAIREPDFVARWGGEEFLIVAPQTDIDGAKNLAERIRLAVKEAKFEEFDSITISLGAAEIQDGESAEALLKRADIAMYTAKSQGRDRVVAAERPLSPGYKKNT